MIIMNPGQTVSGVVSPVDAQGNPSKATLSNLTVNGSDPNVTIALDPNTPNGVIVTTAPAANFPVLPDAAVVTASATATEPDGATVEFISGQDTVTVQGTTPPPPPPAVAASLVFNWGTPQLKK